MNRKRANVLRGHQCWRVNSYAAANDLSEYLHCFFMSSTGIYYVHRSISVRKESILPLTKPVFLCSAERYVAKFSNFIFKFNLKSIVLFD